MTPDEWCKRIGWRKPATRAGEPHTITQADRYADKVQLAHSLTAGKDAQVRELERLYVAEVGR